MTKEQVGGIVRALLAAAAGYFVGQGYDAALVNEIAGAIGVIAIAGWSIWAKKQTPPAPPAV